MSGVLIQYDQARNALAVCARVDEAASIRDKAERLAAYARLRDDVELEIWAAEIKLRATQKIGELSLDLEKAAHGPGRGNKSLPNDGKPFKAQALADAGISTSSAHRAEELFGGPHVNGQHAAIAATEHYFAQARQAQQVPTVKGLRGAIREAVRAAVPLPPRGTPVKQDPHYRAWLDFVSPIKDVADFDGATFEEMAVVAKQVWCVADNLKEAREAAARIARWVRILKASND